MSDNETLDDYISRVNRMVKRVDDLKITIQELMLTDFFKGLSKDLPIALMSLILILVELQPRVDGQAHALGTRN